ncbi:hypothetical protein BKA70DRAFT_583764 [Coprinopsis sp. MPI-PUGE-AT-0042]|nr:hypothetical protein BKA70DRAFT_583764 [Coprinopsis sp. MPI-PUGE-AT-0042]
MTHARPGFESFLIDFNRSKRPKVAAQTNKADSATDVILPTKTELNQAILCGEMPTLSAPIQMGPTASGRSVARSYSASSEEKHSSTEASSLSFGASASYGLFSASASHEQSESHSKTKAELANDTV